MLTGKLPVSSACSVSRAGSVRGVIVVSEYLEKYPGRNDFVTVLLLSYNNQTILAWCVNGIVVVIILEPSNYVSTQGKG